jgi:sialate O-acetylesterase
LTDILVGEVWLGSGQSNMAGAAGSYEGRDEGMAQNLAAAPYPNLRVIGSKTTGWQEGTQDNLRRFSALQFSFGVALQKELQVPVGLLVGAVGGTPSGNWLSAQAFASSQAIKDAIARAPAFDLDAANKKYEQDLAKWKKLEADAKKKGEKPRGRAPTKPVKTGECQRGTIGCLYEQHIRAYIPFAIRGVLWDQGESGTAIQGVDQFTVMGALFAGWRKDWGQGDFPFLYVQKPSGLGCAWDKTDPVTRNASDCKPLPATVPGIGGGREQFIRMLKHSNAFMVTASDLGSGVHPTNKSGYGARAARVALGAVYAKPVEIYGPVYQSHKVADGKVVISFTHVGKGLAFRGGEKLQGFAVAGADKKFVWADAAIEGNAVVLSCAAVRAPQFISYAWAGEHAWANLFNKDGLPALPFRTDDN